MVMIQADICLMTERDAGDHWRKCKNRNYEQSPLTGMDKCSMILDCWDIAKHGAWSQISLRGSLDWQRGKVQHDRYINNGETTGGLG